MKFPDGSSDPLALLKKQRLKIVKRMDDLLIKYYHPSVFTSDGNAIYYKWSSDKAKDMYSRLESLLFLINDQIKERYELSTAFKSWDDRRSIDINRLLDGNTGT